jgi:benzoyl-CoA reductase/2-hydroxyglutaryl-CoA dehydratase subunit BcrC/BadD/HgdB
VRLGARDLGGLSDSYAGYAFARPLEYRLGLLKHELRRRKVAGVIHYTQYACHHILEDDLFREELDLPMLTVQGDLPRKTDEQLKLRLEAFYESI